MFSKTSIKLNPALYERVRRAAEAAGYSSPDEFVAHALEKALLKMDGSAPEIPDAELVRQLRGLGYLK
jgi:Arc/MetJ-type ribon-helix-helix transcriptional regulator